MEFLQTIDWQLYGGGALATVVAIWGLVKLWVKITPSKADDAKLAEVEQYIDPILKGASNLLLRPADSDLSNPRRSLKHDRREVRGEVGAVDAANREEVNRYVLPLLEGFSSLLEKQNALRESEVATARLAAPQPYTDPTQEAAVEPLVRPEDATLSNPRRSLKHERREVRGESGTDEPSES